MLRLRFVALVVWAVGVQVHELIGTIGLAAFVVSSLPEVRRLSLPALRVWEPLWLFIGWSLVAPTLTGQPPNGTGLARTLDWAVIPLVAHAASTLTSAQWRTLAVAAFSTLALSCVVAGLQHFGLWPPESTFESMRWMKASFSRVYEPIGDSGRFMGGGLLFHRLKFAHVSGLVLVGVALLLPRKDLRERGLLVVLAAFAFVAVWLFPHARMGAVAMTAGLGATLVMASPSRQRAIFTVGALGVVALLVVLLVPSLRERFGAALSDQGSGQRTQHLAAGLEAVKQHPLAGVGPGQFRPSKFAGPDMAEHVKENPGKAHNQFLSMAAETGVLGAILFVVLLGWLAARARSLELGALTVGGLVQFAVLSLAHDPLFQAPYSQGLVLLLGLGLSAGSRAPRG
ncbi:MAG: O-antigen ligase family protein [Myxococcota bacterium]